MRQWKMTSCYNLVGNCIVGYCTGDGLERCQMNPLLSVDPGVRHVHNGSNESTATLPLNMGRTKLILVV